MNRWKKLWDIFKSLRVNKKYAKNVVTVRRFRIKNNINERFSLKNDIVLRCRDNDNNGHLGECDDSILKTKTEDPRDPECLQRAPKGFWRDKPRLVIFCLSVLWYIVICHKCPAPGFVTHRHFIKASKIYLRTPFTYT